MVKLEMIDLVERTSILVLLSAAILACPLYLVVLSVYRLYLSPIAHIPGPKLAALTRWYEAYYEIILSGQYSFHIDKLHGIYGPIIRIAPDEIHIRDPEFYDELYAKNMQVEKPGWDVKFGSPSSVFTTVDAVVHRRRRAALNPIKRFSRRSILTLEHLIQQRTELLCKRIAEFRITKQPLSMTEMLPAFTGDIIMQYAFGFSYNQLESPTFESFHEAFMAIGSSAHVASFFPWLIADQWSIIGRAIENQRKVNTEEEIESKAKTNVFREILSSVNLTASDKAQQRLADEANILVAAGVETTAFALCVGVFHIVSTPSIYKRLKKELQDAFPDGDSTIPSLLELEKLPYLKACIQESLRLSYGVSARNPRQHPNRDLRYRNQYIIPKGTKVSMTIVDVHHDETIYPDSYRFEPERWLGEPKAPDGRPLDHYLVAFGRGTRLCLGMNLAWAELFFAMGMMFRRFDYELYQTDESDVRYKYDFFTPRVKLDSKGVRVSVI
ncbi:hypothetical protein UA08_06947 [Talaromyces atroroseus]|uniref:Trichodiene oxygenase n=1 Tax=Talaromyces atroroseus TaxID=1441469 RepID=A0A225ATC9_TALAT|nr:hypothetical protein UA08_06947 [Talaromyces atroroseus]OKL57675.1 hypothetical protein UA08_06947 [Talaromyces atroroseus]